MDQAIKVYNDYCSSNGFDIPGYTYIITATVTQPTETSLPEDDGGGTLTGSDTTSYTSSDTIQTDFPATGTDAAGTLYTGPFYGDPTGTAVATVTLVSGAGTKPNPFQLLQSHASCSLLHFLPCLLVSLPLRLIRALPETLVVTYVPPPPSESPAVTLVETLVKSTPEPAFTSTLVVHYSAPPRAATSTKFVYEDSIDDGQSDSKPEARSDGKQGLTTIELVGIIIGILTGLITTVATVWMCVVRGRRGIVAG